MGTWIKIISETVLTYLYHLFSLVYNLHLKSTDVFTYYLKFLLLKY